MASPCPQCNTTFATFHCLSDYINCRKRRRKPFSIISVMTTSAPLLEKLKNSHNTTNRFSIRAMSMSEIIMSKTLEPAATVPVKLGIYGVLDVSAVDHGISAPENLIAVPGNPTKLVWVMGPNRTSWLSIGWSYIRGDCRVKAGEWNQDEEIGFYRRGEEHRMYGM